ncbi:autoinducer 2 sensor kinase/phosphatase luxQ [Echria macrotheca]|uniref:histidine kinase n=1 Tax=Echria macrotheca TaxID=438768 RepID=A0AAJ0B6T0_9PEZI|nr:autoinducer 2 sensor kinase/phosphatase luxQ [Echria macrotheca]
MITACVTEAACAAGEPVEEVEEVERARQREIAAYLSACSFPVDIPSGPGPEPFINADPTLNALTQLGALRLDCDRSFVSLIDRQYQWVVAEITRSHSICDMKYDGDDRIFLGVAKLDACWGVCPTTMKAFMDDTGEWIRTGPNVIANRTRYIVNDFRTDPAYSSRPYVVNFPYFVSYLEVPLVSPLGYLLGSYCVVDNRTREGVPGLMQFDDDKTVAIMDDIAAAIMTHLDNVRVRQSRDRSEQLIRGLGDFIASEPVPVGETSRTTDTGLVEKERRDTLDSARPPPPPNLASSSTVVSSTSTPSVFGSRNQLDTPLTSLGDQSDNDPNPLDQVAITHDGVEESAVPVPASPDVSSISEQEIHGSGFISSANIKSAFFRAATTIRQAMHLDGLLFLDAVPSKYADQPGDAVGPDGMSGPFCAAIVQSSADGEHESGSHTRLPEVVLQRLTQAFPRGHVFTADEFGPIDESYCPGRPYPGKRTNRILQYHDDVTALFRAIPSAKYIAFLPLWHFQRECWYAATLGWVSDATHALDMTDVNLVTAFGNSVMAEVSRMEALAASHSKSSFVSSISHELRSPLHGIMASSELLRAAISDPWLLSTLDMLDSCGKTLLDTFNNLLDHAITIKDGRSSTAITKQEVVDLAVLVEDVIEAIHFSHASEKALQSSFGQDIPPSYSTRGVPGRPHPGKGDGPPLVTVSIAKSPGRLLIDVGAYKRIIMNIFGNALKYTKNGRVEVSLSSVQKPDREGHLRDYVSLKVEDTGRGMSSDYLKYRLFTPFSQEDTYSPGIGLGLSIVQQLTKGMGGTIEIKSSVGVGTVVEVCLPFEPIGPDILPLNLSPGITDTSQLRGRTLCVINAEAYASLTKTSLRPERLDALQKRAAVLERALRANVGDVLGIKVMTDHKNGDLPSADVYLLDGDILYHSLISASDGTKSPLPPVSPLILLCTQGGASCARYKSGEGIIHLHHPIGPKKLAAVISFALSRPKSPPSLSHSASHVLDASIRAGIRPQIPSTSKPEPNPAPTPSAEQQTSVPASLSSPGETPHKTLHLLLVEDNPVNMKLLTATARRLKHTFASACHGLEAVQLYRAAAASARPFDTVFMDISMPVMDGFAATREIRRVEREMGVTRACRIVALTGLSSEVSRKEALACGSDLFLTKPVKLETVRSLLAEQIKQGGQGGEGEG